MVRIERTQAENLDKNFKQFRQKIKQSKKHNYSYFISQLNFYERQYRKLGMEESYLKEILLFAENLRKQCVQELPGIIYSVAVKIPVMSKEMKEHCAKAGLEYAEKQGDTIHILARLIDLKTLYKQTKQTHKYTETLIREEKELKKICANFSEAKKGYRTFSRDINTRKKYELKLAQTRVDIAKMTMRYSPEGAKEKLIKARKFFERTGREKEVAFIDTMLSQINIEQSV